MKVSMDYHWRLLLWCLTNGSTSHTRRVLWKVLTFSLHLKRHSQGQGVAMEGSRGSLFVVANQVPHYSYCYLLCIPLGCWAAARKLSEWLRILASRAWHVLKRDRVHRGCYGAEWWPIKQLLARAVAPTWEINSWAFCSNLHRISGLHGTPHSCGNSDTPQVYLMLLPKACNPNS